MAVQVFMDSWPIWSGTRWIGCFAWRKELRFQPSLIQIDRQRPCLQSRRFSPLQVIGDRTVTDLATARNLPVGKTKLELET